MLDKTVHGAEADGVAATVSVRGAAAFARGVADELRSDRTIYLSVAAYCIVVATMLILTGTYDRSGFSAYVPMWQITFAVTFPAVFLTWRLAQLMLRQRRGASEAVAKVLAPASAARLVAGIVLMQFLLAFQIAFTSAKNAMPVLQGGFPHDKWQADFDQWLHFGADPVASLHSYFGSPTVTWLLEQNYSKIWFIVTFGCLFIFCVGEQARARRTHHVLLFVASWVLVGNVFAHLFLSAGPIFYGNVTGDHSRFASIAQHVFDNGSEGSFTQMVQAYLWQMYASGSTAFGTGISAFPSVHVAATTVVCLTAWRKSRFWGCASAAYLALILFSSVYLGWHYAIDGYFAIGAVLVIDWLLRRILRPEIAGDCTG